MILKKPRLTKAERAAKILTPELKDIIVGLLLGDLCMQKRTKNSNPRCIFAQGVVHKEYLFHLYSLFEDYCGIEPKIREAKADSRTNKAYSSVSFSTLQFPCFNELYSLFYPKGKKVVPKNIGDFLTPAGLAMWAIDDGSLHSRGNSFILSTNSFTFKEVKLLVSVLKDKFNLDCSIHKQGNQYRIYIISKSMPLFRGLVTPYFHESMIYKLNKK
jgi:LAGLIDADG DNA endonuclease family